MSADCDCLIARQQYHSRPSCTVATSIEGSLVIELLAMCESKDNTSRSALPPVAVIDWDAGEMGCGELILKLKIRINRLAPGEVLKLTAIDRGAIEDIPAWCQMTQHLLRCAEHPNYWIQRKEG